MSEKIGGGKHEVTYRGNKGIIASIPYAVTLGAVNFGGVLYLLDPVEDSFTDGAFVGVVIGTYHIDKNNTMACADSGLLKACIRIDFAERKIQGRLSTRSLDGGWDDGGWSDIVTW